MDKMEWFQRVSSNKLRQLDGCKSMKLKWMIVLDLPDVFYCEQYTHI